MSAAPVPRQFFCRETVEPGSGFHARMFAPRLGIYEDPATGSAAAAFTGVLHHFMPTGKRLADGRSTERRLDLPRQ